MGLGFVHANMGGNRLGHGLSLPFGRRRLELVERPRHGTGGDAGDGADQEVIAAIDDLDRGALAAIERGGDVGRRTELVVRSEEHTSELQSLMRISYAVFCLKKKRHKNV